MHLSSTRIPPGQIAQQLSERCFRGSLVGPRPRSSVRSVTREYRRTTAPPGLSGAARRWAGFVVHCMRPVLRTASYPTTTEQCISDSGTIAPACLHPTRATAGRSCCAARKQRPAYHTHAPAQETLPAPPCAALLCRPSLYMPFNCSPLLYFLVLGLLSATS